ncbi:MAG: 6-phosphogluconolactonase [Myxococcota bacterium]
MEDEGDPLVSGGRLHRFPDAESVAHAGADAFVAEARASIASRGAFRVLLSGGSTPKRMLEILAEQIDRAPLDWNDVRFFFGDERAVGPDASDSNFRMASQALLDAIPEAARHVERARGEAPDLHEAAAAYARRMAEVFGGPSEPLPAFDLVFLGMGDDGHTASLFPGTKALDETTRGYVANEVPQLGTWRLTATYPLLARARRALFLVCGAGKRARMAEITRQDRAPASFHPCERVRTAGRLDWFVDEAALPG